MKVYMVVMVVDVQKSGKGGSKGASGHTSRRNSMAGRGGDQSVNQVTSDRHYVILSTAILFLLRSLSIIRIYSPC